MNLSESASWVQVYVRDCRRLKNGRYELKLSCGHRIYSNFPYETGETRICDTCTNRGGNQ